MTVLTTIPNLASNKDIRDTWNNMLARMLALESGASQPVLSLSSAITQAEGNSGATLFTWTLTLIRNGSTATIPFTWSVAGNGTNPADAADFGGAFPSGSGSFAPGETTKQIPISVMGDTANEPAETFQLSVASQGLNTVTSVGTISNDDVPQAIKALAEGDSNTDDSGPPTKWFNIWAAQHNGMTFDNYAVGGSQLADLQNRKAAVLSFAPTIFVFMIGTNSIPALSDLWAYTDSIRTPGRPVGMATLLPCSARFTEATRAAYNNALRAAVGVHIDFLIDLDTISIGAAGADLDTTLYSDGIHLTAAGQALAGRVAATVLNHQTGYANEPLDFAFAPTLNATPNQDYLSPAYKVKGLYPGETRPLTVPNGTYARKNDGVLTLNLSTTVVEGDNVYLGAHSSPNNATQIDASMTIGTTTATYSVKTSGAGTRPWTPLDLGAKLKLWLRPEAIAGADGAQMATWPDSSGNDITATAIGFGSKPTVKANGLNGFKTVRIDPAYNSAGFTLPSGYLTGRTAGTAFFIAKLAADPPSNYGGPVSDWGSNGDGEFYPYTNRSVYSNYGSTERNTTPPPPNLASWRLASFHAATGDWRYYVDGRLIHQTTTNVFANGANPRIGVGSGGSSDMEMAELVDCISSLTTIEQQNLEGYGAWKYNKQANLDPSHPSHPNNASGPPTV